MGSRLILTSCGLNTTLGRKLIKKELRKDGELSHKRIFVFHEPHYFLETPILQGCEELGFRKENVIFSNENWKNELQGSMDYVYVTEGNIFEIIKVLRARGLDSIIREAVRNGTTYIGASAGAMIAGESIQEALDFEKNSAGITDYKGLELFDGIIIPHYTPTQIKRYIQNSPGLYEKYKNIYSVSNEKVLVIEKLVSK